MPALDYDRKVMGEAEGTFILCDIAIKNDDLFGWLELFRNEMLFKPRSKLVSLNLM